MEELVNLVVKKTGLPKETAQAVVKIVLDFLKKKLPPVAGTAIDGFLKGNGQLEAAADLLGGFLNAAPKPAKKKIAR
jgi:nucleoid DNA-binding protein